MLRTSGLSLYPKYFLSISCRRAKTNSTVHNCPNKSTKMLTYHTNVLLFPSSMPDFQILKVEAIKSLSHIPLLHQACLRNGTTFHRDANKGIPRNWMHFYASYTFYRMEPEKRQSAFQRFMERFGGNT